MKQIKDTIGDDKNDEMMEKFSKGEFTLRDMYEQFENVMKLGPLSKVMAMIPGIPQMPTKIFLSALLSPVEGTSISRSCQ